MDEGEQERTLLSVAKRLLEIVKPTPVKPADDGPGNITDKLLLPAPRVEVDLATSEVTLTSR